jgi:hypothetical protein
VVFFFRTHHPIKSIKCLEMDLVRQANVYTSHVSLPQGISSPVSHACQVGFFFLLFFVLVLLRVHGTHGCHLEHSTSFLVCVGSHPITEDRELAAFHGLWIHFAQSGIKQWRNLCPTIDLSSLKETAKVNKLYHSFSDREFFHHTLKRLVVGVVNIYWTLCLW